MNTSHSLGSLGIMRGQSFVFFEFRTSHRFRVDRDIFENALRVDADISSYG